MNEMKYPDLLRALIKIVTCITDGDVSKVDLTCPQCGYTPLVYSFALNRPPRVGFYIHCRNCGLLHHFALGSKPRNFRDDLILPYYQELENDAMAFADSFGDTDSNLGKKNDLS